MAVSLVAVAGPILALCSIFILGFEWTVPSSFEMLGIFLLLGLQAVKIVTDFRLYKAQQTFQLSKNMRLSHNLTKKQLSNLLKKVGHKPVNIEEVKADDRDMTNSLNNEILQQFLERNKKYNG